MHFWVIKESSFNYRKVISLLQKDTNISERYGIGQLMIADIKNNWKASNKEWLKWVWKMWKLKAMKVGAYEKLDEVIYTSGFTSSERKMFQSLVFYFKKNEAKLLYERLYPDTTTPFVESTGFRSWFIKQYNLHWILYRVCTVKIHILKNNKKGCLLIQTNSLIWTVLQYIGTQVFG